MKDSIYPKVKFGDVVRQVKDIVNPITSGLKKYIAGEHMETDNLYLQRWGEIGDDYLGPAFHMRFKPGQVLYGSRRTYLRKIALADFEGICANTTYVIETKDPDVLLPDLLPFVMQTESFTEHSMKQSKGSVNPYINFSDIAWYEFPLPPLDEQRRMAELLWAVEDVIIRWQESVNKIEDLLISIREDNLCNNKLPRKKLETCVKRITAGKSVLGMSRPAVNNEFGVLKVSAIGAGGFLDDENKVLVDEKTYIHKLRVHKDDILISRANTKELVGRVCKVPQDFPNLMLSDKTLRLEVDEGHVDKDFLSQILRSREVRSQIEASASGTGSAMKNISQEQILNLSLPLPELKTQKRLASILKEVEDRLQQIQFHTQKSGGLKKKLLRNLLLF